MKNTVQIIVADRNPNVRNLLKRELTAFGLNVRLVDNAERLLKTINSQLPIGLLVLDPDLPGVDSIGLYQKLANRAPQLPTILYCVRGAANPSLLKSLGVVRIEKDADSIELIKDAAQDILEKVK